MEELERVYMGDIEVCEEEGVLFVGYDLDEWGRMGGSVGVYWLLGIDVFEDEK